MLDFTINAFKREVYTCQGHLKVEGLRPSYPVFRLLPQAASEKQGKEVFGDTPHPAKGLAAPWNPAFGNF